VSNLLRRLAARVREAKDPSVHLVSAREFADEEPKMLAGAEPRTTGARLVEPSGAVDGRPVGAASIGPITCFMDGMERPRVVLYHSMIPVVYGYVAATVRARGVDRRMGRLWHESREALYFPHSIVDPEWFTGGMTTVDTAGDEPVEEHPMMLLDAARKKVGGDRERLERMLTGRWLAEFDSGSDWLLVDGSLTGDYESYSSPNMIGVVKGHQTQYFAMEDQRKILALSEGERSGVFIPKGRKRPDVYSWYLRLRSSEGRDVYFGLIRVEAAACSRTLDMADEISRWLLAERTPLSLPDARWDRMIYPIRDCEQYLKSLAPSFTMLEATWQSG